MEKIELDDFIRYAKVEFDCEIVVEKSDTPDSFEKLFGISFLEEEDSNKDELNSFTGDLCYENSLVDVRIEFDNGMVITNNNVDQAA